MTDSHTEFGHGSHPVVSIITRDFNTEMITAFSYETGEVLKRVHCTDTPSSLTITPDSKFVIIGMYSTGVNVLNTTTFEVMYNLPTSRALQVAVSPDSKYLAVAEEDHIVPLFTVPDFKLLSTGKRHMDIVRSVCFSPSSKLLISGSFDKIVIVWSIPDMKYLRVFKGQSDTILSVLFLSNHLAVTGIDDGKIIVWDVEAGSKIEEIAEHTSQVYSLSLSRNKKKFASAGADGKVKVFDASSHKCLITVDCKDSCRRVCFIDNDLLVAGIENSEVIVIDVNTGKVVKELEYHSFPSGIEAPCLFELIHTQFQIDYLPANLQTRW